jgi:hypothetical protein
MKAALAVTVALATLIAGTAFAAAPHAVIQEAEGSVMVNRGETYVAAQPGMALGAGDRVMVLDGARAKLTFADGCPLPLVANSIATVPPASPCTGAITDVKAYGPMYAQAVGSSVTTQRTETTTTTTTTTTEEDDDDKAAAVPPSGTEGAAGGTGFRRGLFWGFVLGVAVLYAACDHEVIDCGDEDASR